MHVHEVLGASVAPSHSFEFEFVFLAVPGVWSFLCVTPVHSSGDVKAWGEAWLCIDVLDCPTNA